MTTKRTKTSKLTPSAKLEVLSSTKNKSTKTKNYEEMGRIFEALASKFTDQIKKTAQEAGIIVEVHILIEPQ